MQTLSIEQSFLDVTPSSQRKVLGQFFTPLSIAAPMVRWATFSYTTDSFLDPGVGTGIFTKELLEKRKQKRIGSEVLIDCIDIDSHVMSFASQAIRGLRNENLSFILQDFLTFKSNRLYKSIVSNPPYFKHHYIENKAEAAISIFNLTGYNLPITTNIYCLFMFRARALMNSPGRCAFLIPSEFLNADYGVKVKEHLINDPAFRGLIAFNFKTLIFDDALTTACILLFDTDKMDSKGVKFISLEDPNMLGTALDSFEDKPKSHTLFDADLSRHIFSYAREELEANRKWKNYLIDQKAHDSSLVPLSKYASCSRGIATGANDFFTFNEPQRKEFGISKDDALLCLTKSADVPTYIFDSHDLDNLVRQDSKIYLLNPKLPLSEAVEKYLNYGKQDGIHERYLPSHRDVWYLPEKQKTADIWVMVFSRARTRFVWNQAGINHLTTFHGIYPTPLGKRFLVPLLLYLWSDTCQQIMEEQQRQYGNGLKKYEPRDIERILVPDFELCEPEWLIEAGLIMERIEQSHRKDGTINGTHEEIESFLLRTWLKSE